jgi:ClpX C4-type zinc finger
VEQKFDPNCYAECSFCDKKRADVGWLIAGGLKQLSVPGVGGDEWPFEYPVAICEECAELAKEIIDERRAQELAKKARYEMSVEREVTEKPGTYRQVRMVELRDGEEIVRKAGQSNITSGMMSV